MSQLGSVGLAVLAIVALQLVMKDVKLAEGSARPAQVLLALDLVLSIGVEVSRRVFHAWTIGKYGGYVAFVLVAIGEALVLEALLRVRRASAAPDRDPPEGVVRGVYWTVVGLRAAMWMAMPFLMNALGDSARWGTYGARVLINLVFAGLVVLLARSVLTAIKAAPGEATPVSTGLGPEGSIDLELGEALRSRGLRTIVIGAVWAVIGIVVTVWSMAAAKSGGRYVIAWGAVVFGVVQIGRGLFQLSKR